MIFLLIGYLVCSFLCYGMLLPLVQGMFPQIARERYQKDLGFSLSMGLAVGMLGPVGVLAVLLITGFAKHGFKVK